MNALLSVGMTQQLEMILSLAIAMVVGLILSRLMKLLRLPNITGYLIAGLIVGPHMLNFVGSAAQEESFFNIFGITDLSKSVFGTSTFDNGNLITTIVLGFIAFSIGSSFEIKHMKTLGKSITAITVAQALATALLVDAALLLVSLIKPDLCHPATAIILGSIATATAPAATLMVVKQYKAKGIVTDTLLPVVAMDDAVGLMVFSISFAIGQVLLSDATIQPMDILNPIIEIVASLGLGAALGGIVAFAMMFFKSRANKISIEIASVFAGVALAEMFHLSNLLVCMMIGAVYCNLHKEDVKLNNFSERWTAPLFMLFFVISGAELNLSVIPYVGIIGVVYLIVRCAGKYGGAYVGALAVRADKNVRRYLGITLFPQAGVAIGMATTVVAELSAISPEAAAIGTQINTVVLCATLVYELLGPLLTKWALTKAGEIHPSAVKEEIHDHNYVVSLEKIAENATAKKDITAEQPSSPDQADDTANK